MSNKINNVIIVSNNIIEYSIQLLIYNNDIEKIINFSYKRLIMNNDIETYNYLVDRFINQLVLHIKENRDHEIPAEIMNYIVVFKPCCYNEYNDLINPIKNIFMTYISRYVNFIFI